MNFRSGSKKSVMTKTVLLYFSTRRKEISMVSFTLSKKRQQRTAQNRASGNRVTNSTGNAFIEGPHRHLSLKERVKMYCALQH